MERISAGRNEKMDAECLMSFITHLDTLILTNHGMDQEFYRELCELKQESRQLCELLDKKCDSRYELGMSKLSAYYYDEYLRILGCFFKTTQGRAQEDSESYEKMLVATRDLKELISRKKRKFQDFNEGVKSDLEFFLRQIEKDLPTA